MMNIRLVQTYATILFGKALASKSQTEILLELQNLSAIFDASPKILRYFSAPIYNNLEKSKSLNILLKGKKSSGLFINFLNLLIENNRIEYIQDITKEYEKILMDNEGKIKATIVTARNMSSRDLKICISTFEKKLGKKFIISHKVDPSIIGGAILTYGNNMMDLSVLNMKNKLSREMNEV